jgi:hypothetical protein
MVERRTNQSVSNPPLNPAAWTPPQSPHYRTITVGFCRPLLSSIRFAPDIQFDNNLFDLFPTGEFLAEADPDVRP